MHTHMYVEAYMGCGESKRYFFTKREPSSSSEEDEPRSELRVAGGKAASPRESRPYVQGSFSTIS